MEKKTNKTSLLNLYLAFARIGLFTFGGGYAMLPMLERECVDRYGWTTRDELLNYFAIGQCTPGVIAVNTATFIGMTERGLLGAAMTTLGVVTPSLVIISIIATLLSNFAHIAAVQHAFAGIRVAIGVLIINAVIKLIKQNKKNMLNAISIAICVLSFLTVVFFDLSPVFVVIAAAVVGLAFGKKEEDNK
ncbi:MAG: chromate transporter [Clostridia bacterium]|nr:chromate transporter [Clostridia bacterium]